MSAPASFTGTNGSTEPPARAESRRPQSRGLLVIVLVFVLGLLVGSIGLAVGVNAQPGPVVNGSYTEIEQALDAEGWTLQDRSLESGTKPGGEVVYTNESTWVNSGDRGLVVRGNSISDIVDTERHIYCTASSLRADDWQAESAVVFAAMTGIKVPPNIRFEYGQYTLPDTRIQRDANGSSMLRCWVLQQK